MSANASLAEEYFPDLDGWTRVLGVPSLESLEQRGLRAEENALDYEALGYGLETSETTPDAEWQNLIESTSQAQLITNRFDKLLLMAPGFRLMSRNEDKYPAMAAMTDIWMLQTQQLQRQPPGPAYRDDVIRIIEPIKAANPDIVIWAQITLPPDREPDAEEWLAYHDEIADLVDGTYIGVYTWGDASDETLLATMETIFETVCKDDI